MKGPIFMALPRMSGIGNRWFSEHLYMGSIYSISKAVSAELSQGSRRKRRWRKLGTPKSKA